ncbi:hypothetical protein GUITHDRAFT_164498 [Guillardia theta CCMP2712]|uniref:Uncharacterized protein n=1 Tax=Guillardia theta (strain CCMP2712) TaxID=905079 RepID=L1IXF9_GUITC|nr:hypothetical protein GUITHDRAFT_164498 [Guillardia theta CCMP2712]EKX40911.1 hypothetical protein GUITHDRAFT_164498 [Guillardia theta CCMP2712]|eukprot:XP_005827891.1 hypothetical protein GUITHDRAFT_164498 [Guillardia theta CCMP2712]
MGSLVKHVAQRGREASRKMQRTLSSQLRPLAYTTLTPSFSSDSFCAPLLVRGCLPTKSRFSTSGNCRQSLSCPTVPSNLLRCCSTLRGTACDWRAMSSSGKSVEVGDDYEKGQDDPTSILEVQMPFGHDENVDLAKQLGIYKVYEYSDGDAISRITMSFQKRGNLSADVQTLEAFCAAEAKSMTQRVEGCSISTVAFPEDVTKHFNDIKVPFLAQAFRTNSDRISDSLVFFFETPGGFWSIGWYVPAELFSKEPDLFFFFLQSIKVKPRQSVFAQ